MNRQDMTQTETPTLPLFEQIRRPNKGSQSIVALIIGFFLCTFYAPSAMAIKEGIKQEKLNESLAENQSDSLKYSKLLKEMKGQFKEAEYLFKEQKRNALAVKADLDNASNGGDLIVRKDEWKKALNKAFDLRTEADKLHKSVVNDFAKDKDWIESAELSNEIMDRHTADFDLFKDRYKAFNKAAKKVTKANGDDDKIEALEDLNRLLGQWQFGRNHQYHDGEQLGNFTPKSAKDEPVLLSRSDFIKAGLDSNPVVQYAQANSNFDFTQLPQADDPAYLAETDEVVLTQSIKDKAQELDNDPVKIYHWVRNNIEWIPGWGAYQSAQLTMEAKRGNTMDISSLLIALLRASGIPSRYAIGAIEVSADRYTNWLGDFKNADVASDYASMNGIATQVVTAGGKISKVRMQHLWVEAAIDFHPSKGAKNKVADKWLSLDASFKQYEYQQGLDAVDIAGIDSQALAQQFIDSGTVNETEGYVQNLDPAQLLQAQQDAQVALEDHIDNNLQNPTVGDVIGGRRTIIKEYPTLPSGLPYRTIATGTNFGFLPEGLQHRFGLGFGGVKTNTKFSYGSSIPTSLDLTFFPMAKLNNEKVTLSFKPATQADEDALASLLPQGEITDINQLPSSISGSISVIPELALNGEVFKTGPTLRIGQEIDMGYQQIAPIATYAPYRYSVIAGSYLNIPVHAQVVSRVKLDGLKAKVDHVKQVLESGNDVQLASLENEDILGDLIYSGGMAYFAQYQGLSYLVALQGKGVHKFENGYGSYGYEPNQNVFFGVPRGIDAGGAAFNVRVGRMVQSYDGNKEIRKKLRFQAGLISSVMEHSVPEQMFNDPSEPLEAVSAAKALQLAAGQGQKIYQIDSSNINKALSEIDIGSSVETEIRSAVNQGRIAITHQSNIQVPGWSGAGYFILDPEIMDGSYKISGGSNGAILIFVSAFLIVIGMFLLSAGLLPFFAGLFLGAGSVMFLSILLTLVITGDVSLFAATVFRLAAAAIAAILLGTEVAATVLLASVLAFLGAMIALIVDIFIRD